MELVIILAWFAIAYWAFAVAQEKGYTPPILYGVLAFFGGIIVVVILYILPNKNKRE